MKFLQQDSPIVRLLNRFIDLILLNALWLICSVPLITLGASTSALYDVTLRLAYQEEISILRTFFHAFVHNLKKGTLLFLLALAGGLFLGADLWCAWHWDISIKFVFQVVILAVCYFYLALFTHVFPTLVYFDLGVRATLKKAFVIAMSNGIYTVFIMVLNLIPVLFFFTVRGAQVLFLWLTIGSALVAYLCSLHLSRRFDPERFQALEEEREAKRRENR